MKRILSLGRKELKLDREIKVTGMFFNKPDHDSSCIWGSTLIKLPGGKNTSYWKEYVTNEEFLPKDFNYGVSFTLKRNSKILQITDIDDYIAAMEKYKIREIYDIRYMLDFVRISKDYDAFHLTQDAFLSMRTSYSFTKHGKILRDYNYEDFNVYDAESWIIFNTNVINRGSILNHNNIVGGLL